MTPRTNPLGLALALATLAAGSAQAQDPVPILERSAAVYRDLGSVTARFDQVVDNKMLGRLESHGMLYQKGQSLLALRFEDPPTEAIVADGTYIWIYTPSATPNQVTRIPLPSVPTYGINVLSWILDRPAERYRASYRERATVRTHAVDVIDLEPRDSTLPFVRAAVWLDAESALPRRVELIERSGTHRVFTLWQFRLNRELPPETFAFRVPHGVSIVDQLGSGDGS